MARGKRSEDERALDKGVSTGAFPTLETLGYLGNDARSAMRVDWNERTDKYQGRLFASKASTSMSKDEASSLLRHRALDSFLYALAAIPFALVTIVAVYDLALELTTGQTITIITGYFYGGGYTFANLDPPVFVIAILFCAFFAVVLVSLALSNFSKIRWQKKRRSTRASLSHATSDAAEKR